MRALQTNPRNLQKRGRPLLDYALRPRRITPIFMPYHSVRDDPSVDVEMAELLLDNGANPNQAVHLNQDRSVWALFLLSIQKTCERDSGGVSSTHQSLNEAWYQACRALIRAGARRPRLEHIHATQDSFWGRNGSCPGTRNGAAKERGASVQQLMCCYVAPNLLHI